MIKILVTGASGQLGKCIQDFGNKQSGIKWFFKTSSEVDISKQSDIKEVFNESNFDYLINCAAYTAVDKAEIEEEKAFLINAEAVKYLAEACKINNTILIHISTDFVFDGTKHEPYKEEDTPCPINVYGASKLKGEEYIRKQIDQYFIIRTSWVYSEYGHNFVKTMLRLGRERDHINVVDDQIGSPTYAGDLAEFILFLIMSKDQKYGVYNYSNIGIVSWYDFAKSIFEISKNDISLERIKSLEYPTPAQRPKYSVLDKTKVSQKPETRIPNWNDSLNEVMAKLNEQI